MFRSASIAALVWVASAATAPADAVVPQDASPAWAGEALSDLELDEHRGGFILIDGTALDFSAVVDSYVNGQLVLQSQVTWTQQGAVTSHSGPAAADVSPEILAALAQAGIKLGPGALGDGGFYVTPDGQAAFVHRFSEGQVANLLVNVGDGRDFRQDISITLGLPGFEATQAAMNQILMARSLADEVQAAALAR
ncbi:hypothetical protein [Caulobacter mirabilis]|uniref:Uncharacterized protein n=1 Tax=Caulobacter mirabilis TaxID=69666 RepID=A0A2D2AY81_9CAUL|nr:hypothetical protein [Caulobacter mirabilis]ATQ42968.1 hypothetical protein CSW64_11385 [Caulobacter mirabilis]